MLRTFSEIREIAKSKGERFVVIPGGDDEISIDTAIDAKKEKIAEPVLVGNEEKIINTLKNKSIPITNFELINCSDYLECVDISIKLIKEKKVHIILKGHIDTSTLLKAILDKKSGLRGNRLLSDIFIYEDPLWENKGGKLIGITDGGITPSPTLEQKKQILENAVEVYHKLGYKIPKIAVMSATEKVNPKIQSTIDAISLVNMNKMGEIKDCIVEGPMALDVAIHRWCAQIKGIKSEISGNVDIMLMPSFEAGNMVAKTFVFYMNRQIGHTIVGAKAPILINSRTDSPSLKLNSIALSIITTL